MTATPYKHRPSRLTYAEWSFYEINRFRCVTEIHFTGMCLVMEFLRKSKKVETRQILAIFGLILAVFLTSQSYDFDAIADIELQYGVE